MFPFNPFKQSRYLLHTTLTYADAGTSLFKGADRYNQTTRGRCIMVTAHDEHFTARIEPFTIGQRGTGKWMSHFVVEAVGRFLPTHDGSVEIALGFQRSVSASQLLWRLTFYLLLVGAAADYLWGPVVPVLGMSFAIILAVFGVPWSIIAYFQGMYQAGKDWKDLAEVIRSSLQSHTFTSG